MNITSKTKICCIIGNPVEHSLSPILHNAGYEKLGLNFVFVAFHVENIQAAVEGIRALQIRGVCVTVPHKISVLKYVDEIDETAKKIGAANTILNKNGKLIASNTDWIGSMDVLKKVTDVSGKKVALIGAGGAARALAYGLSQNGANVFVFNRTKRNADALLQDFNLMGSFGLDESEKIRQCDIIINTTSVGMEPHPDEMPIPADSIEKNHIVYDIVYKPKMTKLLKTAQEIGATIVSGDKMLLYQALPQFKLFTENEAPYDTMAEALERAERNI